MTHSVADRYFQFHAIFSTSSPSINEPAVTHKSQAGETLAQHVYLDPDDEIMKHFWPDDQVLRPVGIIVR